MKIRENIEANFKPNTFTKVLVPTDLSASASRISFVVVPPKRKRAATQAIARGSGSNGFPKTLHDPMMPKKPRGRATQTWLRNKNFFMRGRIEYVIENIAMMHTKRQKSICTVNDSKRAIEYKKKDSLIAFFGESNPRGIGRYGFDRISSFQSVAWFSTFDAPFSKAKQMLADRTVRRRKFNEISVVTE